MLGTEDKIRLDQHAEVLFQGGYMAGGRFVSPQIFILELDGKPVGRISSVSLPRISGELDVHVTSDGLSKHIIQAKPDDFTFNCGVGMARTFFDWIKESFKGSYARKNGAIVMGGPDHVEKSRIEFTNAMIASVDMPALDKSQKDPGMMKVSIASEGTRILASGGKMQSNPYLNGVVWNTTAYRLSIDKLEKECEEITKIESIGVGTKISTDMIGKDRRPTISPGSSTIKDFAVSIPQSKAEGFLNWAMQIAKGDLSSAGGRNGTVEYLGSNSKTAYFTLALSGVGLSQSQITSGDGADATAKFTLYCDSIDFSAGSSAVL